MASLGYLSQKRERIGKALRTAEKAKHGGIAQARRAYVEITTRLLEAEVNHARIAPCQRANAARKADAQPSLF